MKYILPILLLLITAQGHTEIVSRNLIGKAADISLTSDYEEATGTGEINVQLCNSCPIYELSISKKTAISKDDTQLDLTQFKTYLKADGNKAMRLQFHKDSNKVFYIRLLSNSNKEDLQ